MRTSNKLSLLLCMLALVVSLPAQRFFFDLEGYKVWNSLNDVAIPGNTGTRFSLPKALDVESGEMIRLRLGLHLSKRHSLSALYAPLSLNAVGTLASDVSFNGRDFSSGSRVEALYRFNSYRLTYAYTWVDTPRLQFQVGFTAKIRDAEIAISDSQGRSSKTNVGFVPLAHLALRWRFSERFHFYTDLDALAAKQGRAEDLFVGFYWLLSPKISVKLGYRTVEGGADNDTVYNFAWLHYLSAGIRLEL